MTKHVAERIKSGGSSKRVCSYSPAGSGPRGILTGVSTSANNIPDFIDESYARM